MPPGRTIFVRDNYIYSAAAEHKGTTKGCGHMGYTFHQDPSYQSQILPGLVSKSIVENGPSTECPSSESEKWPSDASVSKTSSKIFERNMMLAYLHIKLCNSG